jgi:hypothetical protein
VAASTVYEFKAYGLYLAVILAQWLMCSVRDRYGLGSIPQNAKSVNSTLRLHFDALLGLAVNVLFLVHIGCIKCNDVAYSINCQSRVSLRECYDPSTHFCYAKPFKEIFG